MNCFNHPDVPAIGLCKYCQKGLCKECAVDMGYGIACQNHRLEVTALKEIYHGYPYGSERNIQNTVTKYRLASLILSFAAIAVVAVGFQIGEFGMYLSIFVGIVFFIFSLMFVVDANRLSKPKSK